jgi:hypothetical protein
MMISEQDEDSIPHGEERGDAARLEPSAERLYTTAFPAMASRKYAALSLGVRFCVLKST